MAHDEDRRDLIRREELNAVEGIPMSETAMTAAAQREKSMIESRLVVALKAGRNWPQIRSTMNRLCEDPTFAAEALYVKPMGSTKDIKIVREEDGKQVAIGWDDMTKRERLLAASHDWPRGFSIRFIESAIAEAGHFHTTANVIWDDEMKRVTNVFVLDMVRNNSFERTVVISKRKERTYTKDTDTVHGKRTNSNGKTVYTVDSTPEDVNGAEANLVSKAIRTCAERLLPAAYKAEWRALVERTIENEMAVDPYAALKRMLDSFIRFGVTPAMIEDLLGHPLDAVLPAEATILRGVLLAIGNGEGTWEDVVTAMGLERGEEKDRKPTKMQTTIIDRIRQQQKKEADARAAAQKPDEQKPDEAKPEAKSDAKPMPRPEPAKAEQPQSSDSNREFTPEELRELDERDRRESGQRQGGLLTEEDETPITRRKK